MTSPTAATEEAYQLAEGPVWDSSRRRLLWVDIIGGTVLEGSLDGARVTPTIKHEFDGMVGAVAPGEDGSLLVAAQQHLVIIDADGTRRDGPRVIPQGEGRRLNDGGLDPAGRFLVGTLSLAEPSGREILVRLETDGTLTEIDDDLTLSNGLAWSVDGTRMYSVDTLRGRIYVRDYEAGGVVGERALHIHVDDGSPDGIAIDEEDHLWVAVWGAGEVRRFDPLGAMVERLAIPAPHTSSVAFAGDDLRTLVVTTARDGLDDSRLEMFPDSGRLFTIQVEVPGASVPSWSGISGGAAVTGR